MHEYIPLHGYASLHERYEDNPLGEEILIEIKELKKYFRLDKRTVNQVLNGISFNIYKGEVLGIIGASGCGKSTLAKCIMQIYKPDGGEIVYHDGGQRQMIFQDSSSAFNPRRTIGEIIGEPLRIRDGKMPQTEKIYALMEQAELGRNLINRHPYEVSGGQRQRAAIARAISTDPRFIIADEPISSLDVSIQAQIIHLFKTLQVERGLTLLLIAHDLPMVQHISDRIIRF